MTSNAALQDDPAPIMACTISRDVQNFDLLIEDMESELGESWGDLTFEDAGLFLQQPDSDGLEFVALIFYIFLFLSLFFYHENRYLGLWFGV